MSDRAVRAGWSRTRVPVTDGMTVVDIGSGAFPNGRADILCDRDLVDNRHRAGLRLVIDRPLVRADVAALPFRTGSIDFVIVSHLAEHVEDPVAFCAEVARVARAGYLETPSPLADYLLDESYHLWRVGHRDGVMRFRRKPAKGRLAAWLCRGFYAVYNAPQTSCAGPTLRLPPGALGTVIRSPLIALAGGLNRIGVMHTRVHFSPTSPLRGEVEPPLNPG